MSKDLRQALSSVPNQYLDPFIESFFEIERNYRLQQWRPSELDGGRFCECLFSILDCLICGSWGAGPSKPANMVQACRNLEQFNGSHGRSLCILIPRLIPGLYEIRNNRNVGHVGGDVDPNEMDSRYIAFTARWIVAELVRVLHNLQLNEAQKIVHACVEFDIPEVWAINGMKRTLRAKISTAESVMILLYSNNGNANVQELLDWTEYKNKSRFTSTVLKSLHSDRLIELDLKTQLVSLSPLGAKKVNSIIVD